MSIVASLSLLTGLVLGLRFNVRLLLLVCLAVLAGSLAAVVFGAVSAGNAALFGVSIVVALQVGYFVSMVVGAMNLAEVPETPAPRRQTAETTPRGVEVPRP